MNGNIRSGSPSRSISTLASVSSLSSISSCARPIPSILTSRTAFTSLSSLTAASSVPSLTAITGYKDISLNSCYDHGNRSRIGTSNAITAVPSVMTSHTVIPLFPFRLFTTISPFRSLGAIAAVATSPSVSSLLSCEYKGTFHVRTAFLQQGI